MMATNTSIEWTRGDDGTSGATWNPILGCDRISPGCDRCYAITQATIRAGSPHPVVAAAFNGLTARIDGRQDWTGKVNLLPERLAQPLSWRKPKRIFVNSLADMFHKDVPNAYIAEVFAVMALAPQHTFQLLTKRHARMRSLLNSRNFRTAVQRAALVRIGGKAPWLVEPWWPLRNVWLGVSVEDQHWANIRIPALLDTPAAVRWISAEPLLGAIDLHAHDTRTFGPQPLPARAYGANRPDSTAGDGSSIGDLYKEMYGPNLDWVVVGGESGPGARPMHVQWARDLRDQCVDAGVAFHFKQHGQFAPVADRPQDGDRWLALDGADTHWQHGDGHVRQGGGDFTWPGTNTVLVRRARSKHDASRLLDGRNWDEYPADRQAVSA